MGTRLTPGSWEPRDTFLSFDPETRLSLASWKSWRSNHSRNSFYTLFSFIDTQIRRLYQEGGPRRTMLTNFTRLSPLPFQSHGRSSLQPRAPRMTYRACWPWCTRMPHGPCWSLCTPRSW